MSTFIINYDNLESASSYAEKAANEIDDYVEKIKSKVTTKLSTISGGKNNSITNE